MEKLSKFDMCEEIIDILSSFQNMQDMIIYLIGYAEDIYSYLEMIEKMSMVFPENMFNKKFLKQLEKEDSLEEMQNTLTEYCRQLLEKAVNKKSKKLYEHLMEYSISERHKMFGLNYKGKSDLLPSNNETTVATVFGNIRYIRYGVYVPTRVDSARIFAPIDDFLNIIQNMQYPKPVLKRIGGLITKLSYREASKELEKCNITISKQSIWNIVREVIAPRIYDYEKEKTIDFLLGDNKTGDKKKVSTLFIEWDGVWLSLDNTKDESQKTGTKKEMKLGKAYIGWAERYGKENKKSYKTIGTKYVAGFEPPAVLRTMLNGKIDEAFDYANVEQIIVGGDGAKWIFQDYDLDARVVLQLDMFHIKQRINRCIKDKEIKKQVCRLIEEDKYLELIEMLRTSIENKIRKEDVSKEKELYEYLDNNFSALKRYQKTRIVKVDSKMEARNLGTMEASVRQVLGRRMKMSAWSMEGARAMATMLCLEHEGKLEEVLDIVLDRQYKLKYGNVNLEKFVLEHLLKEDMEMMRKGQEANKKIIARGKYAKAIANVEIDFKSILKKNNTIARYIPKSLF